MSEARAPGDMPGAEYQTRERSLLRSPIVIACAAVVLLGLVTGALFVVYVRQTTRRCVVAGTRVATPSGERPVETLREGDAVWCRGSSGLERGTVVAVHRGRAAEHLELELSNGRLLRVTGEHPIAARAGWTEAGALRAGDVVAVESGSATVVAIRARPVASEVFDLSVFPEPCYFAESVLVHNKVGAETAAIGALKTICTAQTIFREGDKENDGTLDYGTLGELSQTQLIDGLLGSGTKQGYVFSAAPSVTTPEFLWFATAEPVTQEDYQKRYFCTNQAGVIFYTTSGPFDMDTGDCTIPRHALPVGR